MTDKIDVKTSKSMNQKVKEYLKMRNDNISVYALKYIEELEASLQSVEGEARPVWVKASEVLPPIGEDNYLKIDNQPFTGIYFKEGYNGIYKDNKSHFNVGGKILLYKKDFNRIFWLDENPIARPVKEVDVEKAQRDYTKFFTPSPIAKYMVSLVKIKAGDVVLEPSAGKGAIVRAIKECYPSCRVLAVEVNEQYRPYLRDAGAEVIVSEDFLKKHVGILVDYCIANPPFENEFVLQNHFNKICDHVKSGGKIVMIVPEYFNPIHENRFITVHPIENWAKNSDGSTTKIKIIEFINDYTPEQLPIKEGEDKAAQQEEFNQDFVDALKESVKKDMQEDKDDNAIEFVEWILNNRFSPNIISQKLIWVSLDVRNKILGYYGKATSEELYKLFKK